MVRELFTFFVAFYSAGGDSGIIKIEASSCLEAKTILKGELPDNYFLVRDCLGSGDMELQLLDQAIKRFEFE